MWTRERKHIGSIWSRALALLSCLLLKVLEVKFFKILKVIGAYWRQSETSKYKQINKQYTKHHLLTKQIVSTDATHRYEHVGTRII
jgi:hypothetical protein